MAPANFNNSKTKLTTPSHSPSPPHLHPSLSPNFYAKTFTFLANALTGKQGRYNKYSHPSLPWWAEPTTVPTGAQNNPPPPNLAKKPPTPQL